MVPSSSTVPVSRVIVIPMSTAPSDDVDYSQLTMCSLFGIVTVSSDEAEPMLFPAGSQ